MLSTIACALGDHGQCFGMVMVKGYPRNRGTEGLCQCSCHGMTVEEDEDA